MNSYNKLFSGRKSFSGLLMRAGTVGFRLSCAAVMASYMLAASPAMAQTVIYDGSQPLNFFSASFLTDDLALTNNPADDTRNGVVSAGADPNVLEVGDGVWFRSTGRRMDNLDPVERPATSGLAGMATGVDGIFMSDNGSVDVDRGVGAGYVLYDANTTTGLQTLNVSVYYNDSTPNNGDNLNGENTSGGSVSVRVWGIRQTTDPNDIWADDRFTFLAGNGGTAAHLSAGAHRAESDTGNDPVVDNLLTAGSFFDSGAVVGTEITPSADWQELSFDFDAGTGYDWLIIAVGGVGQSDNTGVPADRYGFDNISFEPSTAMPTLLGDVDLSGAVDFSDIPAFITVLQGGQFQAEADCDESGEVNFSDIPVFIQILQGS